MYFLEPDTKASGSVMTVAHRISNQLFTSNSICIIPSLSRKSWSREPELLPSLFGFCVFRAYLFPKVLDKIRNEMKRLITALLVLNIIVIVGTVGYMFIENWSLLDAFYMTIISITTTGFAEVRPLSMLGRLLTVMIIITGVSTLAYVGGRAFQELIESQIFRRRKMSKKVKQLKNHYIVCGYGRLGRPICNELVANQLPFVVIEKNEKRIDQLLEQEFLFVPGDATQDETLINAGIHRAKGLIGVLATDAENVYVTLSAKQLNQHLFVVTRAIEEEAEKKLMRAGANRIVKPYEIGAHRMAHLLLRPGVVDFIDIVARNKGIDLGLEEIVLGEKSPLVSKTLADSAIRQQLNIIIVAINREENEYIYNPTSSTVLNSGDRLIAIGHWKNLQKLNTLCHSNKTQKSV